jgi:flavodoxin
MLSTRLSHSKRVVCTYNASDKLWITDTEAFMMKKVVICYNSQTGTTKKFAEEIRKEISRHGYNGELISISDGSADLEKISRADYLFLGSWTKGLMVIFQRPDAVWKNFVAKMPDVSDAKIALFTTYKIRTGSMFKKMRACLSGAASAPDLEIKSKDGLLGEQDKTLLGEFLGAENASAY